MKRRLILLSALLGLGALAVLGTGARQADCGTCPVCEKDLLQCMKVIPSKCKAACAKECELGYPACIKCYNRCDSIESTKCYSAYKSCLLQPCP